MSSSMDSVRAIIGMYIDKFQKDQRVSDTDTWLALQPREDLLQRDISDRDKDRLHELRMGFLDAVSDGLRGDMTADEENAWLKDTFGNMPQMELSELISKVFAEYAQKAQERIREHERSERRKAEYHGAVFRKK